MLSKYVRHLIKDQLFTFLALVFVIAYWSSAHKLPYEAIQYPLFISAITVFFIAWNIIWSTRKFRKEYADHANDKEKYDISLGFNKQKLGVVGITALYLILLPIVGYVVMTLLYLGVLCIYLGSRKPLVIILYPIVLTAIFYAIFHIGLSINLPTGFLI